MHYKINYHQKTKITIKCLQVISFKQTRIMETVTNAYSVTNKQIQLSKGNEIKVNTVSYYFSKIF